MSDKNEFGAPRGKMAMSNHVCDSTPCFNFLYGSMPRNITPTDMDGVVEIDGRFWCLEFKKTGKDVPFGQRLMFERLIDDGWAVSVIWHDGLTRDNNITKIEYSFTIEGSKEVITREFSDYEAGRENLRIFAGWWSELSPRRAA